MTKSNNLTLSVIAFLAILISACQEDSPLDGEQYMKQVSLVGADQTTNEGLRVVEVPYRDNANSETSVSVATSGSLNIDRDITVVLKEAGSEAIDDYNFKYLDDDEPQYQHLNADAYAIPDFRVKINVGEVYGLMPVGINTTGLNADSLYALTFQVESVSDPEYISVRPVDTVLILAFHLINDFSGLYNSQGYDFPYDPHTGTATGDSSEISTSRNLTALDVYTVRLFHLLTVESSANRSAFGLRLKIEDDNSVVVTPWDELVLTDGAGTYDPLTQTISYWYIYQSGTDVRKFTGTLKRTN